MEFPEVFAEGEVGAQAQLRAGFDCVLGNPPWELLQIAEKEFFASLDEGIAKAKNKAARTKLINKLAETNPDLLQEFEDAKHFADAQNKFIRESGRFPLTAKGKINTYAVFAETVRNIINSNGRAGVIVPTGIATDDTTKFFIQDLVASNSIDSFYDITNRGYIFKQVESTFSFSLITISNSHSKKIYLASQLWNLNHLKDDLRVYSLNTGQIKSVNPNTQNLPIFLSSIDAQLILKIYEKVPILINESVNINHWGISFMQGLFNMTNDNNLFKTQKELTENKYEMVENIFTNAQHKYLPLYESKLTHIYNHRASTFEGIEESKIFGTKPKTNELTLKQLTNPNDFVLPRYWVEQQEINKKIPDFWKYQWLLGFRNAISAVADSRSVRFTIIPRYGVGNSMPLIFSDKPVKQICCLLANFNSLILDYVAKQKASGGNLNFFIVKQLPIIPPDWYSKEDIEYISSRVLELVYTAYDMKPFAEDMGYEGEPFLWNEQRRAILRAELDAKYAKLYGLTRDDLRYILAPAEVYGEEFPSETFRVLKNNEIKKYGEYRTQKLVLAAWDIMGY
ncbi:MAG: hypothetical protein DSM107014_06255 [Gomphosphaeria aponina SAG 52.96 = DSM 107014]|uniref:site-specific DNA-methyltransferase (adenine-specific) n=1 Tax=Gomphosphaeria aponina SAG 52.96 = DSM 107014 TaxID=1521640 RepID=A0A941GNP0_9CHRO|nr:hypothetical protein [Gomphosphaeria aponina SAG 52.96 = DSM 107014]